MIVGDLTRRQLGTIAVTAVVSALGVSLAGCTSKQRTLVCRHQRTHQVYAEVEVDIGAEITLSWIHSIELTRWSDTFKLVGDEFSLTRTVFSSYGAGMPMDEGTLRRDGDRIIIEDIDKPFEAIRWVHSHDVDYRVAINGDETLIDAMTLPDHELLELRPS
ncbi:MAG TPA: DUF1850 domain-containing protein [Candidatus Yaniella excrementigallinarum]|nr:DUF1850 domain-containing protein [Candidatus Yaniella excrementigallinarum]